MTLTIIADGRKMTREFSPEGVIAAAAILKANRAAFSMVALTVLLETGDGVTHIICRRERIST